MTIAGSIGQLGINLSKLSKPRAFLAWEQRSASSNVVRNISKTVHEFNQEMESLKRGDLGKLVASHKRFEQDIDNAVKDFQTLFDTTFMELSSLRAALMQQDVFLRRTRGKLDSQVQGNFERELANSKAKLRQVLRRVSDLSTTALQQGL